MLTSRICPRFAQNITHGSRPAFWLLCVSAPTRMCKQSEFSAYLVGVRQLCTLSVYQIRRRKFHACMVFVSLNHEGEIRNNALSSPVMFDFCIHTSSSQDVVSRRLTKNASERNWSHAKKPRIERENEIQEKYNRLGDLGISLFADVRKSNKWINQSKTVKLLKGLDV